MLTPAARIWSKIYILFLVIGCGLLLYVLSPIITPFFIAGLLAYLCNPLALKLERMGMSRTSAAAVIILGLLLIIAAIILLIIPVLQSQITAFLDILPATFAWLQQNLVPWLNDHLGIQINANLADLLKISKESLMQAGSSIFTTMIKSGKALFETLLNLVLIPVVTFYLLRDWNIVVGNVHDLVPLRLRPSVDKLAKECDEVLSAFVRGQLLVMLSLCIFYSIALSILGLHAGIIIGIIIGITNVVPYLGTIVGVALAVLSALIQFGSLAPVLWVLLIFIIGHGFENFYLTPKLIGGRIGVHPVMVIFAILAGGVLFGFIGILLALPAAAVCTVLLRHWRNAYKKSELYKAQP